MFFLGTRLNVFHTHYFLLRDITYCVYLRRRKEDRNKVMNATEKLLIPFIYLFIYFFLNSQTTFFENVSLIKFNLIMNFEAVRFLFFQMSFRYIWKKFDFRVMGVLE